MKYNISACVKEYLAFKLNQYGGNQTVLDFERERAQHEKVKKEISELKLRRIKRELHAAADIEAAVGDMLIRFRSKILSLPSRLAPRLIGNMDPTEIARMLNMELRETLLELAEYSPAEYTEDESEDEDENGESDPEDL